jgi:hypothetical protein
MRRQQLLFGELRSILQRPASALTWGALCKQLEGRPWDVDMLEQVALPYAVDIVRRWPDEVERAASSGWVRMDAETISPLLALANSLTLHQLATRGLELRMSDAFASRLFSSPSVAGLTSLQVFGALSDAVITALTSSSPMRLSSLRLALYALHDADVAALVASANMSALTALSLDESRLTDASAAAIAASPHLSALTSLNMMLNELTDEGATALAASPYLIGLTTLRLNYNFISAKGAHVLSRALPRLTSFDLSPRELR